MGRGEFEHIRVQGGVRQVKKILLIFRWGGTVAGGKNGCYYVSYLTRHIFFNV